jgi:hypothetical protein
VDSWNFGLRNDGGLYTILQRRKRRENVPWNFTKISLFPRRIKDLNKQRWKRFHKTVPNKGPFKTARVKGRCKRSDFPPMAEKLRRSANDDEALQARIQAKTV